MSVAGVEEENTVNYVIFAVMILRFRTDWSGQTVQTMIRGAV